MSRFFGEYVKAKLINFFLVGVIIVILIFVFIGNPISKLSSISIPEIGPPEKISKKEKQQQQKKLQQQKKSPDNKQDQARKQKN